MKSFFLKYKIFKYLLSFIYKIFFKIQIKCYKKKFWLHFTRKGVFINFFPIKNIREFIFSYSRYLYNYTPNKGDIIIDIGSGIGQELVMFSKLVGINGKVISIEGSSNCKDVLELLVKINNLRNVILYHKLFYSYDNKKIKITKSDNNNWMSNTVFHETKNYEIINTITLDTIMKKNSIKKVNFAKFNIEGAERYLINGNHFFLKNCNNISISCHDFLKGEKFKTYKIIKNLLIKNNFIIKNYKEKKYIMDYYMLFAKKRNFK